MKLLGLGALLLASAATLGAQTQTMAAPTVQDDNEITLTGCVIKGDGGYVLNLDQALTVQPAPAGTTGTPTNPPVEMAKTIVPPRVLYWMKDDDDLEEHAGHRVEVKGKVEGDIDRGEIEAEIEEGLIELEFKVDGRKVTVKVPHAPTSLAAAAVGTAGVEDKPKDIPFTVRKVDVKSVKMLSSTCDVR